MYSIILKRINTGKYSRARYDETARLWYRENSRAVEKLHSTKDAAQNVINAAPENVRPHLYVAETMVL